MLVGIKSACSVWREKVKHNWHFKAASSGNLVLVLERKASNAGMIIYIQLVKVDGCTPSGVDSGNTPTALFQCSCLRVEKVTTEIMNLIL